MRRALVTAGPLFGLVLALLAGAPARADDDAVRDPPAIRVEDAPGGPTYADKPVSFWIGELADKTTSDIAQRVLQNFGEAALPQLGAALLSEDATTRLGAMSVIARMKGADVEPLLPVLVQSLGDAHRDVRRSAASLLGRLGTKAAVALPALARLTDDKDSRVRPVVVDAIGKIGSPTGDGVESLLRALRSTATTIYALRALRGYGPRAAEALPDVLAVLDDPASKLHLEALMTAVPLAPGDASVAAHARRLLRSTNAKERRSVLPLLEPLAAAGADVTEALVACLADTDAGVVSAAVRAFDRVPQSMTALLPALPGLLEHLPKNSVSQVVRILGRLDPDQLAPLAPALLGAYLRLGDLGDLRKALAGLGAHTAAAALDVVLEAHPDDAARAGKYDIRALALLNDVPVDDASDAVRRLRGIIGDAHRPVALRVAVLEWFSARTTDVAFEEQLVALLLDPEPALRAAAGKLVGTTRLDAAPILARALREGPDSKRLAALAYGEAYAHFPDFEEAVVLCAGDESSAAVRSASRALLTSRLEAGEIIKPERAAAVLAPGVRAALHVGTLVERVRAVRQLGFLGTYALAELDTLAALLGDPDGSLRAAAVESLERLAPTARDAVIETLGGLMQSGSMLQRAEAVRLRLRVEPAPEPGVVRGTLRTVLSETEQSAPLRVALWGVEALGTDTAALGPLVTLAIAQIGLDIVAGDAARVVARFEPLPDEGWLALRDLARDPSRGGHAVAFECMSRLGERGVAEIVAALDDDGGARRIAAIRLIGGLRGVVSQEVQDRIRAIAQDVHDPHRLEARTVALAWQRADEGR